AEFLISGEGTTVFDNYSAYMKSLKRLVKLIESQEQPVKLFPGHGPVVDDGLAKIQVHPNGLDVEDITSEVYRGLEPKLFAAAIGNVWLQLQKLSEEGQVTMDEEGLWRLSSNGSSGGSKLRL
ncbi:unnamed protein product, partial [Cyprideis torosa]